MADYTFLQSIFSTVDAATATYITDTLSGVTSAATPVMYQCFLLYVILWGFAMYRGMIHEPILDGAFRLVRIGIILTLATNVGQYSGLIANNLIALPDYFATLVGNGGALADSQTTLDKILSDTINTGNELWQEGSIIPPDSNPGAYFMALIVWASALICTGYAAFLMILSKIALGVLVGMGPAFIGCIMFDSTRKFFDAWIGQCINYALVSAFTIAVIKLLFGMYKSVAAGTLTASGAADFSFVSVASLLLLAVICFLVLMQVQSIASGVAGGVAVSTLGAVTWAMRHSGAAGRFANGMRPSQMGRTMSRARDAMKADYRAVRAPVAWAARKIAGGNSIRKAA